MIEQSGLIPMQKDDVCSEGGRYGVYLRYAEQEAHSVGFEYDPFGGFAEVFALLYALLPHVSKDPSLLSSLPLLALQVHDKRKVKGEDDTLYSFPIALPSPEENRLDMALLYIAFEYGLSHKEEEPLSHLPYLFSIREDIRPYVNAGYSLSSEARAIEEEVKAVFEARKVEDLRSSLQRIADQLEEVRAYLASQN